MSVSEVNQLLERFGQAQKAMRQMRRGGGIPGMPGMTGPGKGKQQPQRRKKGKSGNPAKRAEQERLAAQKADQAKGNAALGSAFGMSGANGQDEADLSELRLPKGFEKYLDGSNG